MAYSAIIKPKDYFNTKLYTGTDNTKDYNSSRIST